MIRANLIVIAFILVAGCGYFALDRAVGGDHVSSAPAFDGVLSDGGTLAAPDSFEQEIAPFREAANSATFKVTYRTTTAVSVRTSGVTETVVYQQGTERKRIDVTPIEGDKLQAFAFGDQRFVCGYHQDRSCISTDDYLHVAFGGAFALPSSTAERQPPDLSRLGSLVVPPSPAGKKSQVTKYDMTALGEATTCIHEIAGVYERTSCFSTDGVPLYEHYTTGHIVVTREATEFVRSVSDADFELPYPVVVPTPQPISPLQ